MLQRHRDTTATYWGYLENISPFFNNARTGHTSRLTCHSTRQHLYATLVEPVCRSRKLLWHVVSSESKEAGRTCRQKGEYRGIDRGNTAGKIQNRSHLLCPWAFSCESTDWLKMKHLIILDSGIAGEEGEGRQGVFLLCMCDLFGGDGRRYPPWEKRFIVFFGGGTVFR